MIDKALLDLLVSLAPDAESAAYARQQLGGDAPVETGLPRMDDVEGWAVFLEAVAPTPECAEYARSRLTGGAGAGGILPGYVGRDNGLGRIRRRGRYRPDRCSPETALRKVWEGIQEILAGKFDGEELDDAAVFHGQTFGRWVVVIAMDADESGHRLMRCRCACGNTADVRLTNLLAHRSRSCGRCRRRGPDGRFLSVNPYL